MDLEELQRRIQKKVQDKRFNTNNGLLNQNFENPLQLSLPDLLKEKFKTQGKTEEQAIEEANKLYYSYGKDPEWGTKVYELAVEPKVIPNVSNAYTWLNHEIAHAPKGFLIEDNVISKMAFKDLARDYPDVFKGIIENLVPIWEDDTRGPGGKVLRMPAFAEKIRNTPVYKKVINDLSSAWTKQKTIASPALAKWQSLPADRRNIKTWQQDILEANDNNFTNEVRRGEITVLTPRDHEIFVKKVPELYLDALENPNVNPAEALNKTSEISKYLPAAAESIFKNNIETVEKGIGLELAKKYKDYQDGIIYVNGQPKILTGSLEDLNSAAEYIRDLKAKINSLPAAAKTTFGTLKEASKVITDSAFQPSLTEAQATAKQAETSEQNIERIKQQQPFETRKEIKIPDASIVPAGAPPNTSQYFHEYPTNIGGPGGLMQQTLEGVVAEANKPYMPYPEERIAPRSSNETFANEEIKKFYDKVKNDTTYTQARALLDRNISDNPRSKINPLLEEFDRPMTESIRKYMDEGSPYYEKIIANRKEEGLRHLKEDILPKFNASFANYGGFHSGRRKTLGEKLIKDYLKDLDNRVDELRHKGYEMAKSDAEKEKARKRDLAADYDKESKTYNFLNQENARTLLDVNDAQNKRELEALSLRKQLGQEETAYDQNIKNQKIADFERQKNDTLHKLGTIIAATKGAPFNTQETAINSNVVPTTPAPSAWNQAAGIVGSLTARNQAQPYRYSGHVGIDGNRYRSAQGGRVGFAEGGSIIQEIPERLEYINMIKNRQQELGNMENPTASWLSDAFAHMAASKNPKALSAFAEGVPKANVGFDAAVARNEARKNQVVSFQAAIAQSQAAQQERMYKAAMQDENMQMARETHKSNLGLQGLKAEKYRAEIEKLRNPESFRGGKEFNEKVDGFIASRDKISNFKSEIDDALQNAKRLKELAKAHGLENYLPGTYMGQEAFSNDNNVQRAAFRAMILQKGGKAGEEFIQRSEMLNKNLEAGSFENVKTQLNSTIKGNMLVEKMLRDASPSFSLDIGSIEKLLNKKQNALNLLDDTVQIREYLYEKTGREFNPNIINNIYKLSNNSFNPDAVDGVLSTMNERDLKDPKFFDKYQEIKQASENEEEENEKFKQDLEPQEENEQNQELQDYNIEESLKKVIDKDLNNTSGIRNLKSSKLKNSKKLQESSDNINEKNSLPTLVDFEKELPTLFKNETAKPESKEEIAFIKRQKAKRLKEIDNELGFIDLRLGKDKD